jgi:4-hydroxy-tetrahydrodipicolinate reductase
MRDKDCEVVCIWERENHPKLNCEICGLIVTDQIDKIRDADCVVEFTSPEATIEHLDLCVRFKKSMVIGTTGFSESQRMKIESAALTIPIVFSSNMSIGVNLMFKIIREVSKSLPLDYRVNIVEAHHIHKKDAPSGTAKTLAKIIKDASGRDNVDIESIRQGEIIGDHRVIFNGTLDSIELFHSAKSRDIFAQGAVVAAKWVIKHKKGLFNMEDVLK